MVTFLLDTNVISEPPRPTPNPRLLARLKRHEGKFAISALTWHETAYGVERIPSGPRKDRLRAYFEVVRAMVPILPYDERTATWHALLRARVKKTPPFIDGQIAAIAATNGLTLVTADGDFAGLGVRVVNWLA